MKKVLRFIVLAAALTFVCCTEKDTTIGDDQEQTSPEDDPEDNEDAESFWDDIEWPITEYVFPDPIFRGYVFKFFDIDKDGKISKEEALNVEYIDVSDSEIKSLAGLEYFPKLSKLYCSKSELTSLDVSMNPNLSELDCSSNKLTNLDVSMNPNLEYLDCSESKLTSLDVSMNPNLEYLDCSRNPLKSLDVSMNPNLSSLNCYSNQLTSLDVSKNPNLKRLDCSSNQLTSLDVSMTKLDYNSSYFPYPLNCSNMLSLQTLTLKRGWSINGINVNRSTNYIPSHTDILYVD